MTNEQYMRAKALETAYAAAANQAAQGKPVAEMVIEDAEAYYKFLTKKED